MDDLDEVIEHLKAKGYQTTGPIIPTTVGRQTFVLDPNGVRICLIEHTEEYKKKYKDNNDKKKDIFDKKYRKTVKKKNIYKTKILEKIKENHLKVQKKLKIHQELMKKYSEKKYYTPNYSILDKHTPAI